MTEEEAKTKICPKTFGIPDERDEYGSGIRQGGPYKCFASGCMAWRWLPSVSLAQAREHLAAGMKINAIKALREAFPSYGLLEAKQVIDGDRPWPREDLQGYCGIFGAPQ